MILLSKHISLYALGRLKWILDIIWHFKLKNQRNWLKQVWMLKFWSVIYCIFVHWTKKFTLVTICIWAKQIVLQYLKKAFIWKSRLEALKSTKANLIELWPLMKTWTWRREWKVACPKWSVIPQLDWLWDTWMKERLQGTD